MVNVNIKFNNKDYLLSCDDGQEENLKKLANHLDLKYSELKKDLGNIGENKLLLITAIKMVDDYFDIFKKIENKTWDWTDPAYSALENSIITPPEARNASTVKKLQAIAGRVL